MRSAIVGCATWVLFVVGCNGGDAITADENGATTADVGDTSDDDADTTSDGDDILVDEFITELVDVACQLRTSCECDPAQSLDVCRDELTEPFTRDYGRASGSSLIFDEACADALVDGYADAIACDTKLEVFEHRPDACGTCKVFHGGGDSGSPCTEYGRYDDCAQDLKCVDGRCVQPCLPADAGESCLGIHCSEGLACTNVYDPEIDADEYVCKPTVALGEACDVDPCEPELLCDLGTLTCQPVPQLGEACYVGCVSGAYCKRSSGEPGICVEILMDGEPCNALDVCVGACGVDGVCGPPIPYICDP